MTFASDVLRIREARGPPSILEGVELRDRLKGDEVLRDLGDARCEFYRSPNADAAVKFRLEQRRPGWFRATEIDYRSRAIKGLSGGCVA